MRHVERRRLLQVGLAAAVFAASGLPAAARSRGGVLRAALSGGRVTDSWDARTHAGAFMVAAGHGAVFDCLTEVAADGALRGELAESWDSSDDARIWRFALRRGVQFHDGSAFTSADVIASLRWHLGGVSPAAPIVGAIGQMQALGSHAVQFTLNEANADFPYLLSDYHLVIYPADKLGQGIGTGLYKVETFDPGRRFVGRRVSSHYKDGNAGWFDRVEFTALDSPEARLNGLLTGAQDAAEALDPRALAALGSDRNIRMMSLTGNRHLSIALRTNAMPFADADVRQAIKHGIDRRAFLTHVLDGQGAIGADSPIGPANPWFDAHLTPLMQDPDRARFHLRRAGIDQLALQVAPGDFARSEDAAALLSAQFETMGVRVLLTDTPAPMALRHWSGRATEDWMLTTGYQAGAPWNDTAWTDAGFDARLKQARATLDSGERKRLYHALQQELRDHGGAVIPVFANWVQGAHRRIGMPDRVGALWPMDNARMAERWWRA